MERKEPFFGGIFNFEVKKEVDPASIVDDAIVAFQTAQEKIEAGVEALQAQQTKHEEAAALALTKANHAGEHKARLLRIKERFESLLA